MRHRLVKSAVAVLVGNFLYFRLLLPYLPPEARHAPFRFDLGLLLNAWICLVLYGLLALAWPARGRRH